MERLPVELVDIIVGFLPLPDRQTLRLVSKQLHSLTLVTFASDYFSQRSTTLGIPSLARLVELSARPRLAAAVKQLDVKLLNYEDYENLRKMDRVAVYPPPKRFARVPQVKARDVALECKLLDYMRTHDDPNAVVHPLTRVLKGLPHLEAVRLRVNGLTLYGNPHINAEDNIFQDFLSACFKAVLDAVIRSGVKLHHLTTLKGHTVRPTSKSANLIYPAFTFASTYLISLQNAFTRLKVLRLSIRTNCNRNARVPGWENGVSHFISAAPALEQLTLCLQASDSEPWFRAAVVHSICHTVRLPCLKMLQLYGCVVDERDFVAFIKLHAVTMRHLSISDTELRSGKWISILSSFKQDLHLDYLRLQYLQQSEPPRAIQWGKDMKKSRLIIEKRKSVDRDSMLTALAQAISSLTTAMEAQKLPED